MARHCRAFRQGAGVNRPSPSANSQTRMPTRRDPLPKKWFTPHTRVHRAELSRALQFRNQGALARRAPLHQPREQRRPEKRLGVPDSVCKHHRRDLEVNGARVSAHDSLVGGGLMTSDAVLHTLLNLVPSRTLLDEIARRLAAAQGQPAAPPPLLAASAPAHARAGRGRRRARKTRAPRGKQEEGAVDRPRKLVQRCAPQGHQFDVSAIAELRAVPPHGQISFAEAKALRAKLAAYLTDHPPAPRRHPPADWPTFALAKFLRVEAANLARRLGLRSPSSPTPPQRRSAPAPAATAEPLSTNGSIISPPSRAQLMGGR
jgi:hypothetical protein